MIRINLLDSVTDRPTGVAMVEDRVASRGVQTLLLALTVFGLLLLAMAYDYISAQSAHTAAQRELENQQRIERQMILVNKEQEELQKKTNDIQVRIDAIQKLKASQQGPGAVLREIKARFDSVPGLYLKSIEQKGNELVIKGESPNENSVTRFGQSLEFSGGMFNDLNIETVRQPAQEGAKPAAPGVTVITPPVEVISFVVRCNFNVAKGTQAAQSNQGSQPNAVPNQVAKK
jgi:Tfp pilus assembly protein PilN